MHLSEPYGWIALMGSAIFAAISAGIFVARARMGKWKPVPITITNSGIKKVRGVRNRIRYEPWIHYSYFVNGQSHQGGESEFSTPLFASMAQAESYIGRYQHSPNLRGFYDPNDPSRSVLKRSGLILWGLLAATFSVFALLLAVRYFSAG